jgi:hypothetical protein
VTYANKAVPPGEAAFFERIPLNEAVQQQHSQGLRPTPLMYPPILPPPKR